VLAQSKVTYNLLMVGKRNIVGITKEKKKVKVEGCELENENSIGSIGPLTNYFCMFFICDDTDRE